MEDLTAAAAQPDLVLECSAEPSVLAGYGSSPEYLIHTNLTGCFNCLEIARRRSADFLFVSTSRVYPVRLLNQLVYAEAATRFELSASQALPGASQHGVAEDFPLEGTRSLYGMTKLAAEMMIEEYSEAYGFRYIIDRCGLLTGPWQMAKSDQGVVAQWVAWHHFGKPLRYIGFGGSGKQVRDFLHIDDFCDLVADQILHFDSYRSRRWNVGGGAANSLSLCEATALCALVTGRPQEVAASAEERPADLRIYISDHRRVSSVNGWRPKRDAMRTLTDIYEWIRAEEQTLRHIL
jgi:CDP-paratose 2-epimerase